jgi:hypothetical protein
VAPLVARDFNAENLNQFYQIFTSMCNQRRKKTLDHLYSTHRDAYKALPCPPFDKSDHNSILLIPAWIHPMALRSIPPQSSAWITGNINIKLKALRKPNMTSDDPSSKQSVNRGLR